MAAVVVSVALLFSARAAHGKTLKGHLPGPVTSLQALGALPASTNLQLAIGLPLRNAQALNDLLRELSDPTSTNFLHYLSSEEFTERFGPTAEDYEKVATFARASGLVVTATHPNRLILDVTGSVADIEKAFKLKLRIYKHPTEPRNFHAPDVEPSVPDDLPILDISGLDDYMPPRPMDLKRRTNAPPYSRDGPISFPLGGGTRTNDEQQVSFATGSGPGGDFLGYDFRAAYAPGVTLTGVGQVIGLFEFGPYFTNDIILYKQAAGLPDVTVTNVLLDGYTGIPPAGADDGEEALDIDMAMCMAPGATIVVYEGNSAIDIMNRIATDNKAKQIGCSFGFYPPPGTMDNVFLQYAAQGQTFFVASGDNGAYSTNLIFAPADDPNITSVGGTSLTTTGPRGNWVSETTWIGSGGGITPHYGIPTYQAGMNMSTNHGSTSQRNFPDVAMLADTVIFWYLKNGQSGTVGGTSAAAPLWAGFMALVNQQAAANGRAS
ncbi:MAG TPA: S53 family peptidase, partial [Candidatus Dormibacteraeota bacterium]|nr:S53 family peptidase [Candidatus Dormibacteraeota bacterium]